MNRSRWRRSRARVAYRNHLQQIILFDEAAPEPEGDDPGACPASSMAQEHASLGVSRDGRIVEGRGAAGWSDSRTFTEDSAKSPANAPLPTGVMSSWIVDGGMAMVGSDGIIISLGMATLQIALRHRQPEQRRACGRDVAASCVWSRLKDTRPRSSWSSGCHRDVAPTRACRMRQSAA